MPRPLTWIDEALEALRELLRVDGPIAQAGVVVVARAEPAVVHHEQLDAEFGGLSASSFCPGFVDAKVVASQEL
jgi:hypothetical protein